MVLRASLWPLVRGWALDRANKHPLAAATAASTTDPTESFRLRALA